MTSKCSLGRVLSGPISNTKKQSLSNVNFESAQVLKFAKEWQDSPLAEMLHRLWDIESNGIKDKGTVHESFLRNVTFEGGRYTVSLPLHERHELLPDNHDLSLARLNTLVKRLRKDPQNLEQDNGIIEGQLH